MFWFTWRKKSFISLKITPNNFQTPFILEDWKSFINAPTKIFLRFSIKTSRWKKKSIKWFYSTWITNFRYEGEEEAIKKFSREKLTLRCRYTSCGQNIMYEKCGHPVILPDWTFKKWALSNFAFQSFNRNSQEP